MVQAKPFDLCGLTRLTAADREDCNRWLLRSVLAVIVGHTRHVFQPLVPVENGKSEIGAEQH